MKSLWIWIVIGLLVISGGVYYFSQSKSVSNPTSSSGEQTGSLGGSSYEVTVSEKSFSPLRLEIKVGDSVVFKNIDSKEHWPASVPKPLAGSYPGYNSSKCGTLDEKTNFDSCKALKTGESYTFVFTEKGTWGYWDKLTPSWTGQIKVK